MESSPIDPASNEHVLGGKLLTSQHAGVRRLPRCAQITKRLITEGRARGPRDRRAGWQRKRDETGRDDRGNGEVGIIFSMNYKLFTDRERILPRMCESVFQSFENPNALPSLSPFVSPLLNQGQITRPPCVIFQQCFWPPGLMAQCSL